MGSWSKEAISAHVEELSREQQGDAFVAAVERFGSEELDEGERELLSEVLVERAGLGGHIGEAASERARSGWTRRMLRGEVGRRPRGAAPQ